MDKHITIKADLLKVNFTPYALASMSDGLFRVIESYRENVIPTLRYFLYCVSIELGLKASILMVDNSKVVKSELREKVKHNLIKVYNLFFKKTNETILNENDLINLRKINPFFYKKGLEYTTTDVIEELMKGLSSLPDLENIRIIAEKINQYILKNKLIK